MSTPDFMQPYAIGTFTGLQRWSDGDRVGPFVALEGSYEVLLCVVDDFGELVGIEWWGE